jgi:F-type H+-transporting ATPase subunit a
MLTLLAAHDPADHVLPHRFFELLPWNFNFGVKVIPLLNIDFGSKSFYFTNHMLMMLVAAGLCLWIFPRVARHYRNGGEPRAPHGLTNLFEALIQFIREGVARPVLGPRTDAFMPFLWTMFFFILFCNLLGMVPIDSIIALITGGRVQHVGGTATGNLAVTGGLALCSLFIIHASGVKAVYRGLIDGTYGHHGHDEHDQDHGDHGHGHRHGASPAFAAFAAAPLYLWNFAPHVFLPGPDASPVLRPLMYILDFFMWVVLLLLELLGAIIKPFALMIRLFANMIAGHIVLASILALIPVVSAITIGYIFGSLPSALGCVALSCLELFVAFLQAYIFVFLTTLFIGAAVAPEH